MSHFNEETDYLKDFGLRNDDEQEEEVYLRDEGLGAFVRIRNEELIEAWQTEVNCPEILPFRNKLIDTMLGALKKQTEMVEELMETTDENDEGHSHLYFSLTLYQMEIERVRYSIARYLRARTLKIEKHLDSIMQDLALKDRLSETERAFAIKLYEINIKYMNDQIKNRLNESAQTFYTTDDIVSNSTPDLQQFVYYKAKEDLDLMDRNGRPYPVEAGTIGIASYGEQLAHHVMENKIRLV